MKYNIENDNFNLSLINQNIKNNLNIQTKQINQLIILLKSNENKNNINEKKKIKLIILIILKLKILKILQF